MSCMQCAHNGRGTHTHKQAQMSLMDKHTIDGIKPPLLALPAIASPEHATLLSSQAQLQLHD